MSEHTDFYVGLFSTMEKCEKQYGCAEKELEAWAESLEMEKEQARKLFTETAYNDERVVPLIPVDFILHTPEHPLCDDPGCPCHSGPETFQLVDVPYREGLLTSEEAIRVFLGRQV